MQTIDIISSIILLIVAIALALYWVLRIRNMRRTLRLPFINDHRAIITQALRKMNIKPEWEKEENKQVVHFTYQGGHFNITLEKGSPYARISYLYFYKTDMDRLDAVRLNCNLCNLNTDACRIVYTIDEKEDDVDVHFVSVLPIIREGMDEELQRVMGDAFRWQDAFSKRLDGMEKHKGTDIEKIKADYERELELIREQEMTHQQEGPDWHESQANTHVLSDLLATTMGLTDIIPTSMSITREESSTTLSDPDQILNTKISDLLISDNTFAYKSAFAKLDFYDPRDILKERHLMMDIEAEEQTKDTLYYRVTLSLAPVSLIVNTDESSEEREKKMTSVLLGYDLTPSKERLAHFRYVWKEALDKSKNGQEDSMTEEEKTIVKMQGSHIAENYFTGRQLYLHKRYYEAVGHLTDAFRDLTKKVEGKSGILKDTFDEIAYLIGCCYMCLHQYEKACFYLQITLPTSHESYTEAYINCLVNNHDFRALDTINGLQENLNMLLQSIEMGNGNEDDETEENPKLAQQKEKIEHFAAFVKRRKAYLLVSMGKYDEAEVLLKKLLDDPENSDFALTELAYIQNNKKLK